MKLRPSARANRRYLLLGDVDVSAVKKAILDYIGILGWAKAAPDFLAERGRNVLVVNREEVNNIKAALELSPLKINVLRVSGTLKGLEI
jgi:RNase P/RNase MRP subunit POP5